jgi:pimeloyl-ACP methyl ester carboxylesterase
MLLISFGCAAASGGSERFGKTYYLDGAGNWGWGTSGVTTGLKQAGYPGDVEVFTWTTSLVPLIDQVNPLGAKLRAGSLANKIERYRQEYPHTRVNLIALSAGTGVAVWTVERLPDGVYVDNVVLLGASMSSEYDVTDALKHIRGKIYVYHSPHDGFLAPVKLIGTIDGKHSDAAGHVGLKAPPGMEHRVVNIAWSPEWLKYGWAGGHLETAKAEFVRNQIARHVMERTAETKPDHSTVTVLTGSVDNGHARQQMVAP